MITKERDATERTIAALERRALHAEEELSTAACRGAAKRLRADPTTAAACAFIDRFFAEAEDWRVIHDLRLRVGTHAVQINHVLIGGDSEFVCLDTRFIDCGLRLDESGRWEVIRHGHARTIASPVAKMARDLRKLRETLHEAGLPRKRVGLASRATPRVTLRGLVLTDPGQRLEVPPAAPDDVIGVYPRDALYAMLWGRHRRCRVAPEGLPPERLADFADALVARHRAVYPRELLGEEGAAVAPVAALPIAATG